MTLPSFEIQLTREFYMRQRQACLMMVDAYETFLGISPRTSELRQQAKAERYAELVQPDAVIRVEVDNTERK